MLARVKRLIKEFKVAYGTSAIFNFDLSKNTLALGFKGTSRNLTPIKPLELSPILLHELSEVIPKIGEIERIIDRRICAQIEKEEQKVLPRTRLGNFSLQAMKEERELLSPGEASAMLGYSYKTLWRWWKEGKIGAVRFPSGRLRYYRDDVERLLSKMTKRTEGSN